MITCWSQQRAPAFQERERDTSFADGEPAQGDGGSNTATQTGGRQ